jgi:hypothetical protein
MKLTNEQIAIIDQTLILNGIDYDDIKLELIDHIATDIENELEHKESNFEIAFSKVMPKWKKVLEETSDFWSNFVGPRIVIDKLSILYKNLCKIVLLAVVIFSTLMITITTLNPGEYVYNTLKLVFSSLYFLLCLAVITSAFFIWRTKSKTILGKFFLKNCKLLAFHFYSIYTYLNGHSHLYRHYSRESIFMNFFEWFFHGVFFFMAVYLVMVAVEHFRTVRKYKLV